MKKHLISFFFFSCVSVASYAQPSTSLPLINQANPEQTFNKIHAACVKTSPAIDEMFFDFSSAAKNSKIVPKEFSYYEKTSFGDYSDEVGPVFKDFIKKYMKNIYFSISEGKDAFTTVGEEDLNNSKALFKKLSFSDCIVKLSDELIPGVDYKKWLDIKQKSI